MPVSFRGGSTWKPTVTPTGTLARSQPISNSVAPVTKTSLAAPKQENIGAIGTGHNLSAKPFAPQPQVRCHIIYFSKRNEVVSTRSTVLLTEDLSSSTSSTTLL